MFISRHLSPGGNGEYPENILTMDNLATQDELIKIVKSCERKDRKKKSRVIS